MTKTCSTLLAIVAMVLFTDAALSQEVYVGGPELDDYDSGYAYDEYGADNGLPMVYEGDGMRLSIEDVDPSGMLARGTITVNGGTPMRFRMRMDANGEMYLDRYYPGVTPESILDHMQFKVDVSRAVQAQPPSDAELKILREACDPQRLILGPVKPH